MLQPKHGFGNRPSIRARQTHHADPTAPGRSRNRDDGVVQVHAKIVTKEFADSE
jgi:hypothetical protein